MGQFLQHDGADDAAFAAFRPTPALARIVTVLAVTGTMRFSEVKVSTGVSAKTLTANLRELERNGLVHRRAYATIPPRVEYSLTDIGEDLAQLSAAWDAWLDRNRPTIAAARGAYEGSSNSSRAVSLSTRRNP